MYHDSINRSVENAVILLFEWNVEFMLTFFTLNSFWYNIYAIQTFAEGRVHDKV